MRKTKRKILSGAMALAMAASVLSWAPVQAYAEEPAAVVTSAEETPAPEAPETTETPAAGETPAHAGEAPAETATPEPEVTEAPKTTAAPEVTAEPTTTPEATAEPTATPTAEPEAAEVPAETAQPAADVLTVTDWQWVTDDEEIAQNDTLNLTESTSDNDSGISTQMALDAPEGGHTLESIIDKLPKQIKVSDKDGNVVTLNLSGWSSPEYEATYDYDTQKYAQYGSYVFTATIEDGAQLSPDAKKLQITVYLGEEPAKPVEGLLLDDWSNSNGLPNYGVRIIVPVQHLSRSQNLQINVRVKYSSTDQYAVLETYTKGDDGKYHIKGDPGYTWTYWINSPYDFSCRYPSWSPSTHDWRWLNSNGNGTTNYYYYIFNKRTTEWQDSIFLINNDFDPEKDVLVLRTGTNNGDGSGAFNHRPGVASGDVLYEISAVQNYDNGSPVRLAQFAVNPEAEHAYTPDYDPLSSTTVWEPLSGTYGISTGVRSIPNSKPGYAETIRVTQYQPAEEEQNQEIWMNSMYDLMFPYQLTTDTITSVKPGENYFEPTTDNFVLIRNASDTPADKTDNVDGAIHLRITLSSPADTVNFAKGWGDDYRQFPYRAALFTCDPTSTAGITIWTADKEQHIRNETYYYYYSVDQHSNDAIASGDNGGPYNSAWGINRGESSSFEVYLKPGMGVALFPAMTKYAFSYKVEVISGADNTAYRIDSVDGVANGAIWDEGAQTFQSGTITSYDAVPNGVSHQEIILHTSKQGTNNGGITFTKLEDQGVSLRNVKVNLFDYTVPTYWHILEDYDGNYKGQNGSQRDAELRFVYDSDNNVNDPAVNRINTTDRHAPYTGIVADKLSAITDENGKTVYNLVPDFTVTTPFKTNLFDLNEETNRVYPGAYGLSLSEGGVYPGTTERCKFVYPNANFQFQYDESTGTYSYNSHKNHAQYDRKTNTLYLYDHALGIGGDYTTCAELNQWYKINGNDYDTYVTDTWGSQAAGFFPFDTYVNIKADGTVEGTTTSGNKTYYGSRYPGFDATDKAAKYYYYKPAVSNDGTTLLRGEQELDYHFGLSMEHQFTVPFDGQVKGQDMVFSFSGDDDMWLFVDGQLVLDLGGIHQSATGTINFTKGTYSINGVTYNLSDVLDTYTTDTYAKTGAWAGGTDHSFQMFYLERGGTLSNLAVSFNLPDVDVQATKVWNDNDQPEKRQDVTLYLEQTTNGTDWTKVADSKQTIGKTAEGKDLTVDWLMPMYDETGTKLTYRVRETAGDGYTSEVFIKSGDDTWVSEKDAGYADALAAGHEFQVVNTIPKPEPTATPTPTPKPSETPKPSATPKPSETPQPGEPTATPTATPKPASSTATPAPAKPSNNNTNNSNGSTATATPTAAPTEAPKATAAPTAQAATATIPQTSDNFPLAGAVIGMMVGAAGVAYVGKKKRK